VCIEKPHRSAGTVSKCSGPRHLSIGRSADFNGTVISAAVALGFIGCDMVRRYRLLAECVDQREPSRYSAAGLGQWCHPLMAAAVVAEYTALGCVGGCTPAVLVKPRMISPGLLLFRH
jgi:hypothetical protein